MIKNVFKIARPVWLGTLVLALILTATAAAAGEFKIGRYIEPNQMSNLFTRHVRKGIIKRVGLSNRQLHRVRDAMDPYRETLLAQITDLKDARFELVRVVTAEPFDPKRVRSAHLVAFEAELQLTLTVGVVIGKLRPILTEEQLQEVGEMMEEVRVASEIRFADFSEQLSEGELLGLKADSE